MLKNQDQERPELKETQIPTFSFTTAISKTNELEALIKRYVKEFADWEGADSFSVEMKAKEGKIVDELREKINKAHKELMTYAPDYLKPKTVTISDADYSLGTENINLKEQLIELNSKIYIINYTDGEITGCNKIDRTFIDKNPDLSKEAIEFINKYLPDKNNSISHDKEMSV